MGYHVLKKTLHLSLQGAALSGNLFLPDEARGLIVFAHGSGSSRLSPRNVFVAEELNGRGMASFLFDLLSAEEDRNPRKRFDIGLLTKRLVGATKAMADCAEVCDLPIGFFGASTGAAAALEAAAVLGPVVKAVVSRGGRPDLAVNLLGQVQAPTLLIVGGFDEPVMELNEDAYRALVCEKRLVVVPGATHLFEEQGALEEVARLAGEWFLKHFAPFTVETA